MLPNSGQLLSIIYRYHRKKLSFTPNVNGGGSRRAELAHSSGGLDGKRVQARHDGGQTRPGSRFGEGAGPQDKKTPGLPAGGPSSISLAVSYFHTANAALSSALSVLTSEFGMGSGGSRSLLPPGKLVGAEGPDSVRPLRPAFGSCQGWLCTCHTHSPDCLSVIWSSLTGN